jgi:hypothetical protein
MTEQVIDESYNDVPTHDLDPLEKSMAKTDVQRVRQKPIKMMDRPEQGKVLGAEEKSRQLTEKIKEMIKKMVDVPSLRARDVKTVVEDFLGQGQGAVPDIMKKEKEDRERLITYVFFALEETRKWVSTNYSMDDVATQSKLEEVFRRGRTEGREESQRRHEDEIREIENRTLSPLQKSLKKLK